MELIKTVYAANDELNSNYGFGNINSFGDLFNRLVNPLFILATIIVTFYFLYGVFKLIISGGDKEQVSSAQKTITHAIIGFVLLILAFVMVKFVPEVLGLNNYNVIP